MKNFPALGVQIPEILLPSKTVDPQKWSVIACDQYTSQPEYWQGVSSFVGSSPSTFNLIFPEIYLGKMEETARIQTIHQTMREYLKAGFFTSYEGMVYIERSIDGKTRRGLLLALDLEMYDFNKGSQTLIRATEGTILDRLPPRIKIREHAPLELPHILMLIDDPEDLVIGCVEKQKLRLPLAYDFDLMQSGGHLTGRFVNELSLEEQVIKGLKKLADPNIFSSKYDLPVHTPVLLFASGDGNHSLATAKSTWEKLKPVVGMNHPARYALVEIENVHDHALTFEPIHRVLFQLKTDVCLELIKYFGDKISFTTVTDSMAMINEVKSARSPGHHFGVITSDSYQVATVRRPDFNIPVGTLQECLDDWIKTGVADQIDYVHGDETLCKLGAQKGNAGFYLAGMSKNDLFKTVIKDGSLPRKTFSMGEAHEKRFYFEARRITLETGD